MKGQWKSSWRTVTVLFVASVAGLAQMNTAAVPDNNRARTERMASPGTVNYSEGEVTLNGNPLSSGLSGSAIAGPNQVIATGNGYAEVLLSPGAFLRIGHNSEVRVITAGLADVQLAVTRGSAMVESADLVKGSSLQVTVDGASTRVERGGLYAFDAHRPSVRVLDGKAQVDESGKAITLKKGDEVLLAGNQQLKKRDFSVKAAQEDPLYVWSKVRSRQEAEANVHAANMIVTGGGWYGPGWYWDPFWSGYAFLPGAGMWNSPFGWGFYSPSFFYGSPFGYYRPGYVGVRGFYGRGFRPGYIGGMRAGVRVMPGGGFRGGHR